ncbi:MAG: ABC transporter substrate-binding protein [Bacteroidota bacterium]
MKDQLKIALDWTPNINHIGFYVAQEKGFYEEQGLSVELITPDHDNYAITPAKKVELGIVDFALCPMESIISYQTKAKPFHLVAISSIFQYDLSAIATTKTITSPKDLDDKTYASYKARYEDGIVQAMIKNDGGQGNIKISYPDKLGIWERVISGEADATWIFMNWEGVQAQAESLPLNYFKMADYDIPYSYSPVIAANGNRAVTRQTVYARFLAATKAGYLFAKNNPQAAVELLTPFVPEHDRSIDLVAALAMSAPAIGDAATWGRMETENVQTFLGWLKEHGLEMAELGVGDLVLDVLLAQSIIESK